MRSGTTLALLLLMVHCGTGDIYKDINEDEKVKECVGSIKIFDKDDKELIVVSSTHAAEEKLKYDGKSKGGKVKLEGNCCFEARQKPAAKGGKSLLLTDNKEYSVSFPVKYVMKADCVPDAGTALIPILITLAVLAVLVVVAVVIYIKKRRGITVVTGDSA